MLIMRWARYEELVKRVEAFAASDPAGYRRRVFMLALLGYAYIFLMLGVALGLLALLVIALTVTKSGHYVIVKLAIPVVIMVWVVLKSLIVRVDAPSGMEITATDAPELFRLIEALRQRLRTPGIHKVIVDSRMNAGIVQIPSRYFFLLSRNYLIVGLPYMMSHSPAQFRSVLAHELGHLSAAHGKSGYWIYRVRMTWEQLLQSLERSESFGTGISRRFFAWYVPYFSAYSSVFSRQKEYEADAMEAATVGPKVFGEALTMSYVANEVYERVWKRLSADAERTDALPAPYAVMREEFKRPRDHQAASRAIILAMRTKTASSDTHPSLADRLAAVGAKPDVPPDPGTSAADALLGLELTARMVNEYDAEWKEGIAERWAEHGKTLRQKRKRMEALEGGELGAKEKTELAGLYEEMGAEDKALALYGRLHEESPDNPMPMYHYGRLLLDRADPAGLELMKKAMARDIHAKGPALEAIHTFLVAEGRTGEAEGYFRQIVAHYDMMTEAQAEASSVSVNDTYKTPEIPREKLDALREALAAYPEVTHVYVTEKVVAHEVNRPMYLVSMVLRRKLFRNTNLDVALREQVAKEAEMPFGAAMLVLDNYIGWRFRRKIRRHGVQAF